MHILVVNFRYDWDVELGVGLFVLFLVILEYDPWDVKIGKESGCLDLDKLASLKATLVQNYDPVTDGCEV